VSDFTDIILTSELFKASREDYLTAVSRIKTLEKTISDFRTEVYCTGFISVSQMAREIGRLRKVVENNEH
jgi:hypothetical protein